MIHTKFGDLEKYCYKDASYQLLVMGSWMYLAKLYKIKFGQIHLAAHDKKLFKDFHNVGH